MHIEKLSASSYNTESECQGKYWIDKILKWRFPGKYLKTPQGSMMHWVLEVLAAIKLAKQNGKTTIDDEVFGEGYQFPEDVSPDYIQFLCDTAFNHFSTVEDHHTWEDQHRLDIHDWVNYVLEYRNGEYNPLNSEIIAIEQEFNIPIKESWAKIGNGEYFAINGFIDLIKRVDDGGIEIVDYKSGKRDKYVNGRKSGKKTYEDLMDDIQLLMYRYAAATLYPDATHYIVTIFYVNDGDTFSFSFDEHDIKKVMKKIKTKYLKIRDAKVPAFNKTSSCKYICDYSCNSFDKPMIEFRGGKFRNVGEPMSLCDEVQYAIKKFGIEYVENNYKKPKS